MDKRKNTSAQNGKKGGRPKGSVSGHTLEAQELRKRYIERVIPIWDDLIDAQIEKASVGDMRAIEEINNRVLGKAIQPLAGIDDEGNMKPIPILSNLIDVSANNSDQANKPASEAD